MNYILEKEGDKFWTHTLGVEDEYKATRREKCTKCKRRPVVFQSEIAHVQGRALAFAKVRIYRDWNITGGPGEKGERRWRRWRIYGPLRDYSETYAPRKSASR